MNALGIIDQLAETDTGTNGPARLLDRLAFVFLLLMVLAAPHSIAATQTAWLIGMLFWVIRSFLRPRPAVRVTAVGVALAALFVWTAVSAAFSYEPLVSLDKLRGAAVFLVFVFTLNVVKNRRAVYFLAFALIGSCMVSVLWTPVQKFMGRGVEVHGLAPDGTLARLGVRDGDTLLRVDGRKLGGPAELTEALRSKPAVRLDVYRTDAPFSVELRADRLSGIGEPREQLGFTSWKRSSNFRAAGFYGHYTTFAEVLQLIGALVFGLLVAGVMSGSDRRSWVVLAFCFAAIAFALLLTVTRASQLAMIISSMTIVLLGASRKFVIATVAAAVLASVGGLYFLQQQRQVGFFDRKDGSIQYRQMMARDGVRLVSESPRHLVVGVGMDSIKTHWEEWGLFDKGHQPMGHFHSTPLQLVVERGVPALLIWLVVLGLYFRSVRRGLRSEDRGDWKARGVLLGCLGGAVGFFASGLVHYNLGDQEVAMVFYILAAMAITLASSRPESILLEDSPILKADAGGLA